MMHLFKYLLAVYTLATLTGCNKSLQKADTETIKKAIDEIMVQQEEAYNANSEEAKMRFAKTCDDSLFYIGGDNGGFVRSAQVYVHDFADGYKEKPHHKEYLIFEHTAIVTSVYQTFKIFGHDTIFFNARGTKVFVENDGVWKMAFVTYAPLPVHYIKRVRVNDDLLKEYSGDYREHDQNIVTVSVADGKLLLNSGSYQSALIPVNDSTFIGEDYFGTTVFSKNNKNQVTHHYYEFPDGQRLIFPRVR